MLVQTSSTRTISIVIKVHSINGLLRRIMEVDVFVKLLTIYSIVEATFYVKGSFDKL